MSTTSLTQHIEFDESAQLTLKELSVKYTSLNNIELINRDEEIDMKFTFHNRTNKPVNITFQNVKSILSLHPNLFLSIVIDRNKYFISYGELHIENLDTHDKTHYIFINHIETLLKQRVSEL
jgi:hypothetical protein